jgi:hypothetical protein
LHKIVFLVHAKQRGFNLKEAYKLPLGLVQPGLFAFRKSPTTSYVCKEGLREKPGGFYWVI